MRNWRQSIICRVGGAGPPTAEGSIGTICKVRQQVRCKPPTRQFGRDGVAPVFHRSVRVPLLTYSLTVGSRLNLVGETGEPMATAWTIYRMNSSPQTFNRRIEFVSIAQDSK